MVNLFPRGSLVLIGAGKAFEKAGKIVYSQVPISKKEYWSTGVLGKKTV
jgi:hypothetical protein